MILKPALQKSLFVMVTVWVMLICCLAIYGYIVYDYMHYKWVYNLPDSDYLINRLRNGSYIKPALYFLTVFGLFIRNYKGWIMTLLMPYTMILYTLAELIGLTEIWQQLSLSLL